MQTFTQCKLENLCGQHVLTGRGEMVIKAGTVLDEYGSLSQDDSFVVVLQFDDAFYWFQEDPNDGWRSSLEIVNKFDSFPQDMPPGAFVTFDPIMVTLRIRTEPDDPDYASLQTDEVLYGINEQTGLVLFEVGTENIDNYYPIFVHRWTPEGIAAKWLAPRE